jgi:hypothetical protein
MKDVHQETNKTRGEVLHTGERSLAENKDITYYSVIYIVSIVVLFVTGLLKAMAFVTVRYLNQFSLIRPLFLVVNQSVN